MSNYKIEDKGKGLIKVTYSNGKNMIVRRDKFEGKKGVKQVTPTKTVDSDLEALKEEAKKLGIKSVHNMKKETIIARIAEAKLEKEEESDEPSEDSEEDEEDSEENETD